ncbi:MAG: tRNA guanosine(34) transglycosylase Tgt [Spirochaetes bacterium]|nr:MAG: tRNA guanosine(34) transglycosylase Tgt [Spirochaetota bacterium]
MDFKVIKKDSTTDARTGKIALKHGTVETPVFMPVGTNATVKAMRNDQLEEIGINLILSNTYHLFLRPGMEVIQNAGGLHNFMSWKHNILTDSGGFQIFSLTPFRKIENDGVTFKSHIDGGIHHLTPEKVVEIQSILGSDVMMPLDICTGYGIEREDAEWALNTTTDWAKKSREKWEKINSDHGELWGIVQGNFFKDLREKSVSELINVDFPGYAIGGLSVGEPFPVFAEYLEYTAKLLPVDKPRYVMGIGTPEFILEAVSRGIDLFDCVFPTRTARNALAFTKNGTVSLKKEENRLSNNPIDNSCRCYTCRNFSKAYLRHLYKTKEILAAMLVTYHNLFFIKNLIKEIRYAISKGNFSRYRNDFLKIYGKNSEEQI